MGIICTIPHCTHVLKIPLLAPPGLPEVPQFLVFTRESNPPSHTKPKPIFVLEFFVLFGILVSNTGTLLLQCSYCITKCTNIHLPASNTFSVSENGANLVFTQMFHLKNSGCSYMEMVNCMSR